MRRVIGIRQLRMGCGEGLTGRMAMRPRADLPMAVTPVLRRPDLRPGKGKR